MHFQRPFNENPPDERIVWRLMCSEGDWASPDKGTRLGKDEGVTAGLFEMWKRAFGVWVAEERALGWGG